MAKTSTDDAASVPHEREEETDLVASQAFGRWLIDQAGRLPEDFDVQF